jgi:hypothetical protein
MNLSYRSLFSKNNESKPRGAPKAKRKFLISASLMKVVAYIVHKIIYDLHQDQIGTKLI